MNKNNIMLELRGKPRRAKKTAGRKNTIENNAIIHDIRRIN